jgi:RNA polymerase sigma factor (sigma-70 family)
MNSDHSALWNAFISGDDEAFRKLYRLCYPELIAFGRKRSQDAERIKDAINQTFAYFWEKRHSLRTVTAARSYIYTSFSRKLSGVPEGTHEQLISVDFIPFEPGDLQPSPEALLIHRKEASELQQRIAAALAKLPTRKRELIRLRYYEGLPYDEICRKTGLSSRTVYNKLYESVQFLKAELQFLSPSEEDILRLFAM